jgi:YD repeat-containing protein
MSVRLFLISLALVSAALAQTPPNDSEQPVRVSVTVNPDGTRTSYQFDQAHHQATATTTTTDGKVTGKIKYTIDDAGRFSSGIVMGPDDKFLFKSQYKYTPDGKLDQETHLSRDDAVIGRIVYEYGPDGRQTGYTVYDAYGKVLGKTAPAPAKQSQDKRKKGH